MIKKLFNKYKEIISYVFFGVLATVVSIGTYKLFEIILGKELYLVSNILSWIITVAFAYVTNKLWVFKSKSWKANVIVKEIIGFAGARIFSLVVEEAGLWLLVDICNMKAINFTLFGVGLNGEMIAKIIMQVVVVIMNYVFSKFIIFKKDKKSPPEQEDAETGE